ncbi:MAG TPA: 4Fe-4S dicluster domain-containing protein [Methylomirabilota bacterium]|nr:4Fe-4S dicluster domain-containing protein [Methylomirabilota bacterium]
MRYGFVIDHRRCIGCHACTVACKEENQVPLGAFRTWVKYVEKGAFPHTRRYFSVLRCNHCDNAPCVAICPTVALYRRPDGIVDFDGARCIGCKSCMQGCPYDALYIDPNTNTAAKCHYCAHRLEVGLEPACVIVCPERAIIAGDLDAPASPIARLVAREQVEMRKPEQGTRPKVFYVGADSSALTPSLQAPAPAYLWGQRSEGEVDLVRMAAAVQALEPAGDGALSRPVYDAPHAPRPWGWKVSAYLWTKSISAGALMMAALDRVMQLARGDALFDTAAAMVALIFLALTMGLLVWDLKRPDRFHFVLLKPQWRSWLVRGAFILLAYGVVAVLWLLLPAAHHRLLVVPALVLAAGAAGYSAFLFGQAEGRDFWQSPLLLPHLIVAALIGGAASLVLVGTLTGASDTAVLSMAGFLAVALILHGGLLFAELGVTHANTDVARAARLITRGAYRTRFWGVSVVVGVLLAFVAIVLVPGGMVIGALLALAGLWVYEDVWVRAGQSVPLS